MTTQPRILLFPAGPAQREAFVAARELGLYVIAVDRDPDAACKPLADEFHVLDPGNPEALREFALALHAQAPLSGALVVGCDIPVSCAAVTAAIGTPGISLQAAALTVDKFRMKEVLRANGVAVPDFFAVTSATEVEELLRQQNRRMILKPNDNSGARGVLQLNVGDDCAKAYEEAASNVKRAGVIQEVFEPGPQISIEALVVNGVIHVTGFADRNYEYIDRFQPYILENGATLPTELSPRAQEEVIEEFRKGIKALGIDNAVAKGDMVSTAAGAKVIEIAGRISGGKFASMIVPESSGVRLLHAALQAAVGQDPDESYLTATKNGGVAVRYIFPEAGKVLAIKGVNAAKATPGLLELVMTYKVGDTIGPMVSHAARGGWVVCKAQTRAAAVARAQEAISKIRYVTE